jgi:hypothetical protein
MNYEQLKATYTAAYRIIMRERAMRDKVFAANQDKREVKMAEMDKLLEIIDTLKDELKKYITPEMEQPNLLDAPRKVEYQ